MLCFHITRIVYYKKVLVEMSNKNIFFHLYGFFLRYREFLSLTFVLILAYLWVVYSEFLPISLVCPFKTIWDIPCPGCGGTRAANAILNGNLSLALKINPLSCLLIAFYIVMLVWSLGDGLQNKNTLYQALTRQWDKRIIFLCMIILLANWGWNIYKGL